MNRAAAIALIAWAATPAAAAEVQIASTGPVVEITAAQTVRSAPEIATIGAGVTTRAPTAVAAMQANAAAMERVMARVRALGIAAKDVQTAGIGLNPRFHYANEAPPVFQGYDATNQLSIVVRDVARVGRVLDALVSAGATDINGPTFALDNDTAAKALARKEAVATAQAQALEHARLAGYSGVRLLAVEESVTSERPMMLGKGAITVTAQRSDTPVAPGEIGTTVVVIAKYEMTR